MTTPEPSISPPESLERALEKLEEGGAAWSGLGARDRARRLDSLRRLVARRSDEIVETVAKETGREQFEVLSQEVLPLLESLRYLSLHMPGWLGPHRSAYLRPGFFRSRQLLSWRPFGVVAVLGPANFPFSLGLMTATWLALAGNTVLLKSSEKAPRTAGLVGELLHESALSPSVVALVMGDASLGTQVVADSRVRKVFLFGSRTTGAAVAAQCRFRGIPFVLELGGGTSALVLADANLDRASAAIVWSAVYAAGRACVATHRVFVEASVEEALLARLEAELRGRPAELHGRLEPGLQQQVTDAVSRGARWLGGPAKGTSGTGDTGVLTGVRLDDEILTAEIEGPLVVVTRVDSAEEAIRFSRERFAPLGLSIWTRDRPRARRLAEQSGCLMTWINDTSFGLPNLPWGGRGTAGSGALFSRHSLHEAAELTWISDNPVSGRQPWWFPYTRTKLVLARLAVRLYR